MALLPNSFQKKCTYCNSFEICFVQLRKNKSINKPVYLCKGCNRRFTFDDGFKRFRHPPFIINTAIRLIRENLSLNQIVYNLNQNFRIKVSRKTILDWKEKFLTKNKSQ